MSRIFQDLFQDPNWIFGSFGIQTSEARFKAWCFGSERPDIWRNFCCTWAAFAYVCRTVCLLRWMYPLVNCYITNWNITNFKTGRFSTANCLFTRGYLESPHEKTGWESRWGVAGDHLLLWGFSGHVLWKMWVKQRHFNHPISDGGLYHPLLIVMTGGWCRWHCFNHITRGTCSQSQSWLNFDGDRGNQLLDPWCVQHSGHPQCGGPVSLIQREDTLRRKLLKVLSHYKRI